MAINATQSPFIQWELNEDGTRKTTEQLNEEIKIMNNQAVLNFKPSRYHRVNIASQLIGVENVVFTEIDANEKINLINQFKVNYENGIIYFHPDLEGYTLTVSKYYSEGLILYHASRIYDYDSEGAIITFDNFDLVSTNVGDLETLTTTDKSSLVGAVNEVDGHADTNATSIGTLASLTTTEKGSLVGAINETQQLVSTNVGDLETLTTTDKSSLVNATNEVKNLVDTNMTDLAEHKLDYIEELSKKTFPQINNVSVEGDYPPNKEKFDTASVHILDGFNFTSGLGVGLSEDTINTFDGNNTIGMTSVGGGSPYMTKATETPIDLTGINYFDLYMYFADYNADDITIRFRTTSTDYFSINLKEYYRYFYVDRPIGWRKIRFTNLEATVTGTPNWNNITSIFIACTYNIGVLGYTSFAQLKGITVGKALISIDFDDAVGSVYSKAFDIMKSYGLIGSAYVITSFVGNTGRMTWEQLRELRDNGWLIGSHTHTHPSLINMSLPQVKTELDMSIDLLRQNGLMVGSYFFAAPAGMMNQAVFDEVEKRFIGARYSTGRRNTIPPIRSLRMSYESVVNTQTVDDLKAIVIDAKNTPTWYIFTFHGIDDVATLSTDYQTTKFNEFCSYLADEVSAGNIQVVTPLEVILQKNGIEMDSIMNNAKYESLHRTLLNESR